MRVTIASRSPYVAPAAAQTTTAWRASARTLVAVAGAGMLLIAFGLRCAFLDGPSLWYDEGVSWSLARLPWRALLAQVATSDFNPPLYFSVLHVWMPLAGSSAYALRYLSVIAGTLVIPLCWVLAHRIFQSRWAAAMAAGFAATSIFLIDFSQEARGYALAAALAVLAAYALLRILDQPESALVRSWWWVYALSLTAGLYVHYAMVLLVPGHALVVALRRRQWAALAAAWLGSAALYLPWLPELGRQLAAMRAAPDFWSGTVAPTLAPARIVAAIAVGPGALSNQTAALLIAGALWLVLMLGLVLGGRVANRPVALLPTMLVLLPILEAVAVISHFPKFIDRYLLPIAPFAYVAMAGVVALAASARGWLRKGVLSGGVGALLVVGGVHALQHAPRGAAEIKDGDTRAAVAYIEAHAQSGDAVLLAQDTGPVFSYYYDGKLGGEGQGWFGVVPEFSRGDDLPVLAAAMNRAARGHLRLWVLLWHEDFADPTGYLRNTLDATATPVLQYSGASNYDLRLYRLRPGTYFSAQAAPLQPMNVRFGPHITFLGLGLEEWERPADVPFVFHTWFRTDAPLHRDYQAVLRLERDGHIWQQLALRPSLYTYPAQHWLPGIDVPGRLDFTVGPEVPPGDYHVTLSLYDPVARSDLSAVDAQRGAIGTRVDLGLVRVLAPQKPAAPTPPPHLINEPVDTGLQLWGSSVPPGHMQQGARVDVALYWRTTGPPSADYTTQVTVTAAGVPAQPVGDGLRPPAPGLGTRQWPPGSTFKDIRTVQLPARLPPGPAELQVRLQAPEGAAILLPLAAIVVDPRPRVMLAPPNIGHPVGALFGDAAFLAGVQIDASAGQPNGQVVVTLFWQCRKVLSDDYKVFVHLLDAANTIGGRQHDGPPNGGADPTTSWIPGQWISDQHVVPIPASTLPGTYRLEVGLYRQIGTQFVRLPLADGHDAVIAGTVTIR